MGAACFLVLPALLLGSCMLMSDPRVATSGSSATAGQARDDFRAMLDDTQALIGGDWVDQDDPTPRACVVQWGLAGETYASLRLSATTPDTRLLSWVQREWERLGYDVERTEIGPASQLTGRTSIGGELVILRVSDRGVTLQGESACRPAE